MNQVQSLAFAQFLIDINKVDLFGDPARLQSKPRTRTNKTTASDNADFHDLLSMLPSSLRVTSWQV